MFSIFSRHKYYRKGTRISKAIEIIYWSFSQYLIVSFSFPREKPSKP